MKLMYLFIVWFFATSYNIEVMVFIINIGTRYFIQIYEWEILNANKCRWDHLKYEMYHIWVPRRNTENWRSIYHIKVVVSNPKWKIKSIEKMYDTCYRFYMDAWKLANPWVKYTSKCDSQYAVVEIWVSLGIMNWHKLGYSWKPGRTGQPFCLSMGLPGSEHPRGRAFAWETESPRFNSPVRGRPILERNDRPLL